MKTCELTGALLDYWVARAEGAQPVNEYGRACLQWPGSCVLMDSEKNPRYIPTPDYSTEWAQGGPIIERERIELLPTREGWEAGPYGALEASGMGVSFCGMGQHGQTPLVAAMRVYVASKFGADVADKATA